MRRSVDPVDPVQSSRFDSVDAYLLTIARDQGFLLILNLRPCYVSVCVRVCVSVDRMLIFSECVGQLMTDMQHK